MDKYQIYNNQQCNLIAGTNDINKYEYSKITNLMSPSNTDADSGFNSTPNSPLHDMIDTYAPDPNVNFESTEEVNFSHNKRNDQILKQNNKETLPLYEYKSQQQKGRVNKNLYYMKTRSKNRLQKMKDEPSYNSIVSDTFVSNTSYSNSSSSSYCPSYTASEDTVISKESGYTYNRQKFKKKTYIKVNKNTNKRQIKKEKPKNLKKAQTHVLLIECGLIDQNGKKCTQTFSTKSARTRHVNEIHGSLDGKTCPKCNRYVKRKRDFKKHLTTHENLPKKFVCTETGCTSKFAIKSILKRHYKLTHNKEFSVTEFNAKLKREGIIS